MIEDAVRGPNPGNADRSNEFALRVVSSTVMAAIALAGTFLGGWAAALVLGIVTAIVHLEWANLTDRSPWPSAVFTAGLVVALAIIPIGLAAGALTIIALAIAAAALTMSVWRAIGVAYAATLGAGLLFLRLAPDGLLAVVLVLAVVWATDTAAFATGRAIGGARLWPAVSPGKTWAGAIGGIAGGLLAGIAVVWATPMSATPILMIVIIALSVATQVGDLFESWVKRRFGAKDAGKIVPGHGGLMDRVDGLVFATGLAVLLGWLHGGSDLARGLIVW